MRVSDIIEEFIKEMFDNQTDDFIEIQRNELAEHFNCVPSQINYVISTRFKPSQGYYVKEAEAEVLELRRLQRQMKNILCI